MGNNRTKPKREGFTIIEVMIVLAVAGLILLIVLLAVPALQRNSRNTQRKSDVSQLIGLLKEVTNNADGQLPATCNGGSAGCFINDSKLTQYNIGNIRYRVLPGPNNWGAPDTIENIEIFNYMKCNPTYTQATDNYRVGASGALAIPTGASAQSLVIIYDIETSNGTKPVCQDF